MLTVMFTKVIGRTTRLTASVNTLTTMVLSILVSGMKIDRRVLDLRHGKTHNMRGTSDKARRRELASSSGQMAAHILECSQMTQLMDKESTHGVMEDCLGATGGTERWKVEDSLSGLTEDNI